MGKEPPCQEGSWEEGRAGIPLLPRTAPGWELPGFPWGKKGQVHTLSSRAGKAPAGVGMGAELHLQASAEIRWTEGVAWGTGHRCHPLPSISATVFLLFHPSQK